MAGLRAGNRGTRQGHGQAGVAAGQGLGDRHHADRGGGCRHAGKLAGRTGARVPAVSGDQSGQAHQAVTASSKPWRNAAATAARRPRTPSLAQALRKWKFTVLSLTPKMRAVSQLVLPAADQYRQAAWRSDSILATGGADSEVSGEIGGFRADMGWDVTCRDACNNGRYADKRRMAVMAAGGGDAR
ncbi:hypothetical protein G6F65_019736 [Rhizopus arrhizus]|nr:hypothetical protein G6F65_019736 [Rhizopus arrhizus]